MELPRRTRGDELLPSGEMVRKRQSLRARAKEQDIATVIVHAFDRRTRLLPFIFADVRMAPAGVRAIGSALYDAGFEKTRIVLQQWNRNFSPLEMRLDGRMPDIFMVSSMQLHGAECDRLVREVCRIDPDKRPLVIVGGPRFIYEPWLAFSDDPDHPWAADVVVTGEEYVLLSLLDLLLDLKASGESLRSAFVRARDVGALDDIPGLVYARSGSSDGPAEELIDTGIQRLLGDFDELPSAALGYRMLEPPSLKATLGSQALPAHKVRAHTPVSSIVMTSGCKFRCKYCPIPAYNQSQHRTKSGARIAEEIREIHQTYNIKGFFGTDDNFLNKTERSLDIAERLAASADIAQKIRIGTEATVHDTLRMREHLPLIRRAGFSYFWLGVEDMTATLVKKGQNRNKTIEAFRVLRESGIIPMPMMMHHDEQPLFTVRSNYGLINQVRQLRKAGAMSYQVLVLIPSTGSQWYAGTYTSGTAFSTVGNTPVEPYTVDGSYVIASNHRRPWTRQFNLLAAYTYFYNPLRLLSALILSKSIPLSSPLERDRTGNGPAAARPALKRRIERHLVDAFFQFFGMVGLAFTYYRTFGWGLRLIWSKIERATHPPQSAIPMRSAAGGAAPHALPGTAVSPHQGHHASPDSGKARVAIPVEHG